MALLTTQHGKPGYPAEVDVWEDEGGALAGGGAAGSGSFAPAPPAYPAH